MPHGAASDVGLGQLLHADRRHHPGIDALLFEDVLQRQGVDHGREHAHVVGGHAIHALLARGGPGGDSPPAPPRPRRAAGPGVVLDPAPGWAKNEKSAPAAGASRPGDPLPRDLERAPPIRQRHSAFPDLQPGEPAHVDLFAGLGRQLFDQLAHRAFVVLHELLLEQDVLFVESLDHPFYDLATDVLGLFLLGHLSLVYLALPRDGLGRQVFDPHRERVLGGDVDGQFARQRLEVLGARYEIRFAIELHQHAELAVVVQVVADETLGCLPAGAFIGLGRALGAQHVDGLLQVSAGFLQRLFAVHHSGAGAGAQLRHELRRDLFHGRHTSSLLMKTPPSRRWARRAAVGCPPERVRPAWLTLAFASAARFCRGGRGCLVRLEPCGDRFRLGATLPPRRLLLLVALRLRLDTGLRRVRHPLAFLGRLAQRHLVARFRDDIGDGRGDQRNRADRVVVAGDRDRDQLRIGVRVHDGDHGNPELVRLGDRNALLLRVHDEQRPRQPAHVLDARQVLLELHALALEQQLLFLGVVLELTLGGALLQLLQPLDLLLDGLEVGERAAQPALRDVERAAALRLRLDDVLELLLRANEEHVLTLQDDSAEQLLRGLDLPERLLEVDDVNPRPLGENEPAHLGIPAARLVAEMDTRFQQKLQRRLPHALPLVGSIRRRPHLRCNPSGGPSTGSGDVCDLSLTELEPLARARAARLLPLDHPRIPRQQSLFPQFLTVPLIRQAQRSRDREPHRPSLPGHPAAPAQRPHVEGAQRVGRRERLLDVRHERRPGEVIAQRAPVDVPLPRPRRQIDARHPDLAASDRVPAQLRRYGRAHQASARLSGSGCWAACGGSGPAYTFSICATGLASRPSASPAASTTNQRRVTSSFRSVNVFIPTLPNGNPVGDSRELYPSRKGLSTRGFRAREGHERGAFFDRLTNRNMDCLHRPRARRAQLVLHFHRLHDHESSAGIHPLTLGDFDPHHQTGHRCAHRPAAGGGLALGADRLASALALVLHQHLHPLPHHPQRPPPNALQRLGRDGPRLSAQQQMIEGRPRYRRELAFDLHPIHGHTVAVHLHLMHPRTDRDEIRHAASITATVSTCAVWGNRSNARTAVTR